MKSAAIYTRKSKFTTSGESIETQISLCRDYASERLNINEFTVYEDEGFSGGDTKRPNLQRMLMDAKNKRFDVIICYRLDRISRNVADFTSLISELEILNIKFVSIREQFDTSTPMGRAMMSIAAVFAQLERETIAERVKDNMLELAKTGRWLGGITPTGFESRDQLVFDEIGTKKRIYYLNPIYSELEKVKTIYCKFLELKDLSRLQGYLSSQDIKSKNDRAFDRSSLKLILTNPVYAFGDRFLYEYFRDNNITLIENISEYTGEKGVLTYNKYSENRGRKKVLRDTSQWIIALGHHSGIIPSRDWIEVQNLLMRYKKNPPRLGTSNHALLTSLLHCSQCGSPMRVTSKYKEGKVTSYYYKCTGKEKTRGGECSCPNLNGIEADKIIIDFIKSLEINEDQFTPMLNSSEAYSENVRENFFGNLSTYKKQVNKYQKSIDNLMNLLSQNEDSSSSRYIIKEIEELHIKLNNVEDKIKKLSKPNETSSTLKEVFKRLVDINSNIDNMDIEFKKRLVREIIRRIDWDGETLAIHLDNA